MASTSGAPEQAWADLVDSLRDAGERLVAQTAELSEMERADALRALLRGLNNQLGRFEVDRERPELVAFNGWREKMFMDNPDFRRSEEHTSELQSLMRTSYAVFCLKK